MKKILLISIAFLAFVYACDKVDSPYIEKNISNNNNSEEYKQNILIEDYTAHYCTNCPRAARELENLKEIYGKQIIPIAIHVGLLASPGNVPFNLDLRTLVGDELDNTFELSASGLPKGMVNRAVFNGDIKVGDGDWASAVGVLINKTPSMALKIQTALDTITRKLNVNINVNVLKDTTENLNLCVYLVENNIIGAQKDQDVVGGQVTDYIFNHVLRTSINGTWGETISNSNIKNGEVINVKYENFEISNDWNMKNLGVVVFAYDIDSKEVIQADYLGLFSSLINSSN